MTVRSISIKVKIVNKYVFTNFNELNMYFQDQERFTSPWAKDWEDEQKFEKILMYRANAA